MQHMMSNDTTNQTSIELQETSHGEQKNIDKIYCSTDDTKKTATDNDNRRRSLEKSTLSRRLKNNGAEHPTASGDVINANTAENETWRKSEWLNIQDDKKLKYDVDPISFPVSEKYQSCCSSCLRLCCHSLVDADDLILRQERQNLQLHVQEREFIETQCDKKLKHVMDCSMGICCKKPKSCCSYGESCWKSPVTVWGYRVWQLAVVLMLFFVGVNNVIGALLCEDSPFFESTTGQRFDCPAVQEQFRNSNHTNGYAGMIKTMKVLEESNLELYGSKFSEYFNTSNIDSETGYPEGYDRFLWWHATSSSFIPDMLRLVAELCFFTVMPVSMFLVFGMQFQKDDPIEIMFPPLLETKITAEEENAEEVEPDMEIGLGIEKLYSQSFHFVRPKRFVLQASLWSSVGMFFVWLSLWSQNISLFAIFSSVLVGVTLGPVVSIILVGLFVQIHNATTLANILVQLCSIGNFSSEQRQAQFEQWKDYYKTTVGALHIWSWRLTPIIGSVLLVLGSVISGHLVGSIFVYTAINSEPDIPESDRMAIFMKVASYTLQLVVSFTIFLLGVISAMAMVSARYKRLYLLVATLRLPKHQLEDFAMIQKYNAAVTIFDVPITVKTVVTLLRLLFIQTVLVALASAGS